ncbi:MAG TPA: DsbA family protein [Candidatus Kapabacteria bacterium]|nr:DsbA family protein [Candidatus Kapabacteria bacterium]
MDQKPTIAQVFSPVQLFVGGIVSGILVLCTIGFFIMLGMYLKGDNTYARNTGTNPAPSVVAGPVGEEEPTNVTVRPVDTKTDHIRGNKNAKVSIVTFTDYECPFCKRFHGTMQEVMAKFNDDVRWVYRQLPLDSLHSQARKEALASECAAEQGKFWEWTDLIFSETTSNDGLDLGKLPTYAGQVGLNVNKFNDCVNTAKYAAKVQADEADAQAAGARGTPYSVVIGPNGETRVISGAYPAANVEAVLREFVK